MSLTEKDFSNFDSLNNTERNYNGMLISPPVELVRQSRTTSYYRPNLAKATFGSFDDDNQGFMIAPVFGASLDFSFK